MEVISEIPEAIFKIVPLGVAGANLGIRAPTLLLTKHTIIVVNGENGSLVRKYELKSFFDGIEDCVYVSGRRSFVVLLTDGSLVTFSEQTTNLADIARERWPHRPVQLLALENDLLVYCEGGYLAKAHLKGAVAHFPVSAIAHFFPKTVSLTNSHVHLTSTKQHIALAITSIKEESSAKRGKAKASVTAEPSSSMFVWPVDTVLASSAAFWLTSDKATHVEMAVDIRRIYLHEDSLSLSLVLNSSSSSPCMWLKMTLEGEELLRKDLGEDMHSVHYVSGDLWTVDNMGKLACYQSRYASVLSKLSLGRAIAGAFAFAQFDQELLQATALMALSTSDDGPSVLYQTVVDIPPKESQTLLAAMQAALQSKDEAEVAPQKKAKAGDKEVHKMATSGDLEKIQQLVQQYHQLVDKENDPEKVRKAVASVGKKRKLLAADLEDAVRERFLENLIAFSSNVSSMDWEFVKPFIRSGDINMSQHGALFHLALQRERMDVVAEMLRFTADVEEIHAVWALDRVLRVSDESMEQLSVVGCALWWTENYIYDRKEGSFAPAVQGQKITVKKGKGKSKEEAKPKVGIHRLQLLQAVMESILLRRSAFTTYTISEAVQSISPAVSAVVIRVLTFIISGICSAKRAPRTVFLHSGEEQLQRAITWIEGILDGHMASFALEARRDDVVRQALSSTIAIVAGAQQALEHAEDLLGSWMHIERVLTRKGTNVQPFDSLYQVERLSF